MAGWIEPPDPSIAAEYWVTRRAADVAPGAAGRDLPDIRVRYRWVPPGLMGTGSWITGYREALNHGRHERVADLCCLHSGNGWRIERLAEDQSP